MSIRVSVTKRVNTVFCKREPVLMQFGTNGPLGKGMLQSTLGSGGQRSESKIYLEPWRRHQSEPIGSSGFSSFYLLNLWPMAGSLKISRRDPCSPFFSVSYSINRHKIL